MIAVVLLAALAVTPSSNSERVESSRFAELSLEQALARAVAASPDVAIARAKLAESEAALALARNGATPSLVANYNQIPQGNPPTANVVSRQLDTGIQFSVADLIALGPAERSAASARAAAEADLRAAELAERSKVVTLYFEALKDRALATARGSALDDATHLQAAAKLRLGAGDAPRLDFVRAQVATARARAEYELALAVDRNAVAALLVEADSHASLDDTIPVPVVPTPETLEEPAVAIALARAQRPELLSAARSEESARAAIASARASAFPPVTVTAGYLVGTDSGVPVDAPAFSAQLTLPLSGGAAHARVATATAVAIETAARAAGLRRTIELEVGSTSRSLAAAERAATASGEARVAADAELQATELGYRSGATASLEVSAARATDVAAVVDDLTARYDLEKARALLNLAVGRDVLP